MQLTFKWFKKINRLNTQINRNVDKGHRDNIQTTDNRQIHRQKSLPRQMNNKQIIDKQVNNRYVDNIDER